MTSSKPLIRTLLLPVLAGLAFAVGACGNNEKVERVQDKAAAIRQQGADLQDATKKAADDVAAGRRTQAEADAELKERTDKIQSDISDTASDAIDVAKDDARVPDEAKKALEDAQQQLEQTTP